MFALENTESVQNVNSNVKKKKRKHQSTVSELNLDHQEGKVLKLTGKGEPYKKKRSKRYDEPPDDNMHSEISSINNLPNKKKKKKKREEKTEHTLDVFVTERPDKSEVIEDDLKVVSENVEQSEDHLFKKKKKKKEKTQAFELLDQQVTKHIKSEVDEDLVKKSKKKKNKERVALPQEEEKVAIVQKKNKKKKHKDQEAVDTSLVNSINVYSGTEPPPKKSKKHKHKDKQLELNISESFPLKLKKKKHGKNVTMSEDAQVSFFADSSTGVVDSTDICDKSTEEDVEPAAHRKTKKRKYDVEINRDTPCAHEDVNINTFDENRAKKYKTVHSMEEKVGDTDNCAIDTLIKTEMFSSPEGGSSRERNDTARSESVSNDTFTMEVHEDDTHSILNDTVSSNDLAQEKLHRKKHCSINHCNGIENCVKSNGMEAICIKNEALSYQNLLEQVQDKSQMKENSNLTHMSITMPWPVPPLHSIETRVSGRPTKEQRILMDELGIEIKLGIFNKNEDDQIKNNWKEFCRLHDLPDEEPTPFLNFMQPNGSLILPTEERINFVRFLAHGLCNRPLFSVYKRFQRLFLANKIITGRFSQKEDEIIRKYMECTSRRTPYSDLAKILNRDRLAVEKRCKALECKDDSLRWEKENIAELLKYMLQITGSDSLSALKDREIKSEEWKSLSKKLDIPTVKLQRAWVCTIHPQLFISNTVSSNAIKVPLIKKLIENNENDWRAVNWEHVAKDFDGFTARKLNKFIKDAVHYHVPQHLQNNLGECLQYLEKLISQKKIFSRRTLKKLHVHESLLSH